MATEFQYAKTLLAGPPRYDDIFLRKHPPMDRTHRAKIFAPFDALDGFDHTLRFKDVVYLTQTALSEDEAATLDKRLRLLAQLTKNGKQARENRIVVSIKYFAPCADIYSEAYGTGGTYDTVTGVVWLVDPVNRVILVGEAAIGFENIRQINGPVFEKRGIAVESWEDDDE
ncbi:MAG: hypothetical protein IKQ92_03145 [Clostridia bacterium]|nr:hypothetical protein [Clostridia bacterium]